jgi:D-beta-D-heptose 7-phosphate kinase/D-beta-D-heptose 1-phosphate adenosyltransferase
MLLVQERDREATQDRAELVNWIEQLGNGRVLVLGDLMFDRFVYGEVSRISPEGPVPVLKSIEMKSMLGGAGNVVRNLLALGAKASFVSLTGADSEGMQLQDMVSDLGLLDSTLIVESERRTTVKTRFIAGQQQLLRVDSESVFPLEEVSHRKAVEAFCNFIHSSNVVILSDYGKGFLSPNLLRSVIEICIEQGKPVLVDPKGTDYSIYRNASVLTPNLKELGEATRLPVVSDHEVISAARRLIESCQLQAVLATRSQDGMTLVESSGRASHLKAKAQEVFDVTGAGDTVIATLAAGLAAGAPLPAAAELANIAAGIVVAKVGTAVPYPADMIHAVRRQELSAAESKVLDVRAAIDRIELWRRKGYKIGFINGFFELLHAGHLRLLSQASRSCDRLVVGIHCDSSVIRIKGEQPVLNESARSSILASLEDVDIVVIFHEDTPNQLLNVLRPDVLIKGADCGSEFASDTEFVRGYGGNAILVEIGDIGATNASLELMTKGNI